MKNKVILSLLCACSLMACTQNEEIEMPLNEAISFQAVNYMPQTKALSGSEFTYKSFGVYAWSASAAGAYFMDNETVTLQSGQWLPSRTYYWPKEATVDFISYNPQVSASDTTVTIAPKTITYKGYKVTKPTVAEDGTISTANYADINDLMYADKVVGMTSKMNTSGSDVTDKKGNAYKTVPAYFRHALSRININVAQAFASKTIKEKNDSITRYKWVIKVDSAFLKGVDTKGNLELQLSSTPNSGLGYTYPWVKPENGLWSNVGETMSDLKLGKCEVAVKNTSLLTGLYIMPQALKAGKQQVTINMNVLTYRSLDGSEPTQLFLNEHLSRTVNLYIDEKTIPTWQMNHDITYNLVITPTAEPKDPGDDPDDPDLKDIEIHFDPAVADWTSEGLTATIKL